MLATKELLREAAQKDLLAEVLPRYLGRVPLYRGCNPANVAGPAEPMNRLQRLPFITKADIRRQFPGNFLDPQASLDDLVDRGLVELEHTSGTSEIRTPLLLPSGWWLEQEARALRLNPLVESLLDGQPNCRRVTISSPVCSSEICYSGLPPRSERVVGNTLFLSLSRYPFLWSESDLDRMVAEALDWQPGFLDVDPVYGAVFARHCERRGIRLPSLRVVICSYEFVSGVHRRILQRAFGVPVCNLYGSTETGHLLMEDGHGRMEPSLETAVLELVDPDPAGIGDLVVTTLTNDLMPLVRYRIGDLAQRLATPYATRFVVHGRAIDAFHTRAGRITTWQVDQCVSSVPGILHYQLTERGGDWLFRYVPEDEAPKAQNLRALQDHLADLLQVGAGLSLQSTDLLMPEASGKFRLGYPARAGSSPPD